MLDGAGAGTAAAAVELGVGGDVMRAVCVVDIVALVSTPGNVVVSDVSDMTLLLVRIVGADVV